MLPSWLNKILGKKEPRQPPIILTPYGAVSESARLRAAMNMREDPARRLMVEELLAKQMFDGDIEKARKESRRRYPESYQEEK